MYKSHQKENEDPKMLCPKSYILFTHTLTPTPAPRHYTTFWGCDKTKELGWGVVNCGTVNRKCMWELTEHKGYFSRLVCTDPYQCQRQVSGDKNVLFLVQGVHLSLGIICFQMPSAQKSQYAKAAYLGGTSWSSALAFWTCASRMSCFYHLGWIANPVRWWSIHGFTRIL